jgi:hypothetical protein
MRRSSRRVNAVSDLRADEREQPRKAALRPYKKAIKTVFAVLLFGSCLSLAAGAWILALSLLASWGVVLVSLAFWMARGEPWGATERTSFPIVLELRGVVSRFLPKGCLVWFVPQASFLGFLTKANAHVRAAQEGETGVRWLLDQLDSGEAFDRWRAIVTLTKLLEPRSAPGFTNALSDPDPYVREAAAQGLAALGDVGALSDGLKDHSDDFVWLYATSASALAGEQVDVPRWRLVRLMNTISPTLKGASSDSHEEDGWDSERAMAFGTLPLEATEPFVRDILTQRPTLAFSLFKSIGAQRTDRSRDFLIEMLNGHPGSDSSSLHMMRGALHGLRKAEDPLALPAVERVRMEHQNVEVRRLADVIARILSKKPDL